MTPKIQHTFAFAIVNADGFLLGDEDGGRCYIFADEEQAHAYILTEPGAENLHVTVVAIVPGVEDEDEEAP